MPTQAIAPHDECSHIREVFNRVGDKWSLLVVAELMGGARRFGDLRRSMQGISQRMLTLTLRLLEREGLVARTALATVPVSVEYELTELGCTLIDPVRVLAEWAQRHAEQIQSARVRFDESVKVRKKPERAPVRAGLGKASLYP
jgi:DNA-binding HxlR family transcriptional regulator